jgi:UDP-3-O-[3-hydroxymyristoyl] glucosamine N-acyltransferase
MAAIMALGFTSCEKESFINGGNTSIVIPTPEAEPVVVVINPSVKIGIGCIVNTCSSVDHDCVIDNFTHLCPNTHFAGTVSVGKYCTFGIGTQVINNINICDNACFGAGAVVVKDIVAEGTYIGVPAKIKE